MDYQPLTVTVSGMSVQPTDTGPTFAALEAISEAALEAAQKATTAAEGAAAAAIAASEKAASFGMTLPAELVEQIGNVAGVAAAAATEERLRQIGALRDLGEEGGAPLTPPADGVGGEELPGEGGAPASPAPVVDPLPGDQSKKSWAARFLGE